MRSQPIVLHWLAKSPATLKIYVANRVANIQNESNQLNTQWKWVASEHNPADLISRGTMPSELNQHTKWWHGPIWLRDEDSQWPSQSIQTKDLSTPETEKEVKSIHFTSNPIQTKLEEGLSKGKWFKCDTKKQKTFTILEAFGEWSKLLGVIAMLQFQASKGKKIRKFCVGRIQRSHKISNSTGSKIIPTKGSRSGQKRQKSDDWNNISNLGQFYGILKTRRTHSQFKFNER